MELSWNSPWNPPWDYESEIFAYLDFGPPRTASDESNEKHAFDLSAASDGSPYYGPEYFHGNPGAACDDSAVTVPSFYASAENNALGPTSFRTNLQLCGNESISQSPGGASLCMQTRDFPADERTAPVIYTQPLASNPNRDEDVYECEPDTCHDSHSSRSRQTSKAVSGGSSASSSGGSASSSGGSADSQVDTSGSLTTTHASGLTPQHERNREKNRMAASRCREKSKKLIGDLRRRERELTRQRQVLKDTASGLQDEVLALKHEVLSHGRCDCKHIRNYLATAVRQIA